ncbi:MAG: hypothetical protein ACREAC_18850 [Blastocatellia bacterium]
MAEFPRFAWQVMRDKLHIMRDKVIAYSQVLKHTVATLSFVLSPARAHISSAFLQISSESLR